MTELRQNKTFQFDSEGLRALELHGLGVTDDGYDAVVLSGGIILLTDDVLVLAAALQGLAIGITTLYVEAYGTEDLVARMDALEAEATGQSPLPFPGPTTAAQHLGASQGRLA